MNVEMAFGGAADTARAIPSRRARVWAIGGLPHET